MSGSLVFPATEIFLGCSKNEASNIIIYFLFSRKLYIFFHFPPQKEGFVGLYNC